MPFVIVSNPQRNVRYGRVEYSGCAICATGTEVGMKRHKRGAESRLSFLINPPLARSCATVCLLQSPASLLDARPAAGVDCVDGSPQVQDAAPVSAART